MATNKTRIVFYDNNTTAPQQVIMCTEFDIYQEALDYVNDVANLLAVSSAAGTWYIDVLSYDQVSWRYYELGSTVVRAEIEFPSAQP